MPQVSVIIPTFQRGPLLQRAVRSVLRQQYQEYEVIVVSDGPDPTLLPLIEKMNDRRLRLIALERHVGANGARNAGVRAARGEWVALLDDDDEWLPSKLEVQMRIAARSRHHWPIVGCRAIMRTPRADLVVPRREPEEGEPLSEYLFVRRSPFHGEGLLQTSTLLAPRVLFSAVPFNEDLPALHETDWLLRAASCVGVGIEVAGEELSIWHTSEQRSRLTRLSADDRLLGSPPEPIDWALIWARQHRALFTRRGYAAFMTSVVSYLASVRQEWRQAPLLLWETVRYGTPSVLDILVCAMIWLVPYSLRRSLRDAVLDVRGQRAADLTTPVAGALEARSSERTSAY